MDQQRIDRLFREKLDQLEVTPSAKSWSQVEKHIRPKKPPVVYWIAASVSLLFISWIIWPEATQTNLTPIASEVTHPVNQQTPDFILPEIEIAQEKEETVKPVQKVVKQPEPIQQFAANQAKDEKATIIKDVVPEIEELDTQTAVAEVELEEPVTPEGVAGAVEGMKVEDIKAEKPTYGAIKITYIASASKTKKEETQKSDSTGVLKKFIAFTEKIDPGNMLADIKTAKDNLFNGGLKNKKERSSL